MLIMKTVLTFCFILFIHATTVAQHTKLHHQVDTTQMDVVLVSSLPVSIGMEKAKIEAEDTLALLYRYQNSRVKKALSFKTKKDRPKLA